jgi:hypothetical protein
MLADRVNHAYQATGAVELGAASAGVVSAEAMSVGAASAGAVSVGVVSAEAMSVGAASASNHGTR